MLYCTNDPCDTEATTERDDRAYCYTCAEAYDSGYNKGWDDAMNDSDRDSDGLLKTCPLE